MKRIYLCKFAKLVLTVYRRAISAIRNIQFLSWFVWVTSCFNSDTIQWSPLKNLRVGESLLNGQKHDFSKFFQDSSFGKLPERSHPIFTCSKSTMETLCSQLALKKLGWRYWPRPVVFIVVSFEHILHTSGVSIVGFEKVNIHLFKVNYGNTRIMYQICSKLAIKKLGWRYWPRSGVFNVVNLEHISHIVLAVPLLVWRSKYKMRGLFLIFVTKVKWLSYRMSYD